MRTRSKGIYAALASAVFMGMTPVFGKQAILAGASPLAVVALRTLLAALLLFCALCLFDRRDLYIYPAGLLGCLLAGWTNGIGSLFYYSALARLDASVGHLLYSLYPLFLLLWLSLDRQPISRLTLFRLVMVVPAVYLLTQASRGQVDLIGTSQMLIAAALYALHIPINQRVLYEMPAPTVTVYTLLAMGTIVGPVYLLAGVDSLPGEYQFWGPILGLTLVTFLSRLTLFLGVKHIGGMQTALLGLSELLVAIFLSFQWLGERFSMTQWTGAILLAVCLLLVIFEKPTKRNIHMSGWLSWIRAHNLPSEGP
jgi:drug/metabolite transporter (DMT)-like permease